VIVDGAGALPVAGDIAVSFRGVTFRYPETVGEPVSPDIKIDIVQNGLG
jgi:hypothetical protein